MTDLLEWLMTAPAGAFLDVTRPPDWFVDAACQGRDPDLWWTHAGEAEARRVCRVCLVRLECLQWALDEDMSDGIWGGLDADERRRIARGDAA